MTAKDDEIAALRERERINVAAVIKRSDYWQERAEAAEAQLAAVLRAVLVRPPFIEARDTEWDEGVNYAIAKMQQHVRAALASAAPGKTT